MAVISFEHNPGGNWVVARWRRGGCWRTPSRCLVTTRRSPGDCEGIWYDCLSFPLTDKSLALRCLDVIKRVVAATLNDNALPGMTWKEGLDQSRSACIAAEFPTFAT